MTLFQLLYPMARKQKVTILTVDYVLDSGEIIYETLYDKSTPSELLSPKASIGLSMKMMNKKVKHLSVERNTILVLI